MSFHTYIIYSSSQNRYYIGQCENLEKRLLDHCNSRSGYTKGIKDWELKWSVVSHSRSESVQIEQRIKKKKSRKYLEYLIAGGELA